ncbi:hypothetical protein [Methanobrevibacter sp.]|uniref:hypothetical protein n=1 Tax=Methanobrevibacter sp. TaxID=66852 RepID=UPI00386E80BB
MDFEIDLELYTFTIVNMNSSFERLEQDEFDAKVIELLNRSIENLKKIYQTTLIGISLTEINYGEYDYFLFTVFTSFPRYIKNIKEYNLSVINNKLKLLLIELIELLESFVKISEDYFKKRGVIT